jgi:putative flippase GtrA
MTSRSLFRRTTRYTMVGAICAAAYNVVMLVGDRAGGHYVPLSFLAFGLVTPLGYSLHARFTFRTKLSFGAFLRFAAGAAMAFPLYFAIMAVLCSGSGLAIWMAAPTTTILLYIWNYMSAHWAMRHRLLSRAPPSVMPSTSPAPHPGTVQPHP